MIIIHRIIILVICSFTLHANDTYYVQDYIDHLIKHHAKPQSFKTAVSSAKLTLEKANAFNDTLISSSISNTRIEPQQTSPFVGASIDTFATQLSLSRPVLLTGGKLSVGMTQQRITQPIIQFNGLNMNQPTYFDNLISVSYTQPLLYGFLGEQYQLPILIASTNVQTISLQSKEHLEAFLVRELSNYIDWVVANEATELSFSRLQLARESYKQTKDRVRVNLSEKIDLLRAESALERAHQFWLTQKAQLKSYQFKLSKQLKDKHILLKTPMFELYEMVDIKKPSHIVVRRLRSVQSMAATKRIHNAQLNASQSQRNGNLTLIGRYDILGGNTNFQDSLNYKNNNASIALQYSRPLSDAITIAQVKQQQQELTQFELDEEQAILDLESEILRLHTLISEYKKILTINLNQIMISQNQAEAEEALYKQGRTSLDMVIQSQDNVLNAKLNFANLSATYQKQVIGYQALTDELLDVYGVKE